MAEPTKNFSDSDQPGILSNLNESANILVIDLEKREENETAKYNSAPVKSKQKGKGKKKSKSGSSTNCDNDSIVDQHCAKSPTDPSNNAVIPNQGDHDDNYHNNSMQSHSLYDNQNTNMNTTKSDKKVTVIAGDSIVKKICMAGDCLTCRFKELCWRYHRRHGGLPETRDSQRTRVDNSSRGHK